MKTPVKFSLKQVIDLSTKATLLQSVSFGSGNKVSLQTECYCFGCKEVKACRIILDYSTNSIKNLMCIDCYQTGNVRPLSFEFPGNISVTAFCIKDEYFISLIPSYVGKKYYERYNRDTTRLVLQVQNEKFNQTLIEFIQNIELMK